VNVRRKKAAGRFRFEWRAKGRHLVNVIQLNHVLLQYSTLDTGGSGRKAERRFVTTNLYYYSVGSGAIE
jgi:hypothetical protein